MRCKLPDPVLDLAAADARLRRIARQLPDSDAARLIRQLRRGLGRLVLLLEPEEPIVRVADEDAEPSFEE